MCNYICDKCSKDFQYDKDTLIAIKRTECPNCGQLYKLVDSQIVVENDLIKIDLKEYGYNAQMVVKKEYRPTQEDVDELMKKVRGWAKENKN